MTNKKIIKKEYLINRILDNIYYDEEIRSLLTKVVALVGDIFLFKTTGINPYFRLFYLMK